MEELRLYSDEISDLLHRDERDKLLDIALSIDVRLAEK